MAHGSQRVLTISRLAMLPLNAESGNKFIASFKRQLHRRSSRISHRLGSEAGRTRLTEWAHREMSSGTPNLLVGAGIRGKTGSGVGDV